jgi:hypothetical protein
VHYRVLADEKHVNRNYQCSWLRVCYRDDREDGRRGGGVLCYVGSDLPCAGLILLGDFNHLNDPSIVSYPLKQVVECKTRKTVILDKIFTNIACWYDQPMSTRLPSPQSANRTITVLLCLLVVVISITIVLNIS